MAAHRPSPAASPPVIVWHRNPGSLTAGRDIRSGHSDRSPGGPATGRYRDRPLQAATGATSYGQVSTHRPCTGRPRNHGNGEPHVATSRGQSRGTAGGPHGPHRGNLGDGTHHRIPSRVCCRPPTGPPSGPTVRGNDGNDGLPTCHFILHPSTRCSPGVTAVLWPSRLGRGVDCEN